MILTDYYKAEKFPTGSSRYEIVSSTKSYEVFENTLINKRNPNVGGQSFYYTSVPENFKAIAQRKADRCISKGGNISSVYVPNVTLPYAWGDIQNPKTKILTTDAILLVFNTDCSIIELFIARNQRNNARQLYQLLCDGLLEEEITHLRKKIK